MSSLYIRWLIFSCDLLSFYPSFLAVCIIIIIIVIIIIIIIII